MRRFYLPLSAFEILSLRLRSLPQHSFGPSAPALSPSLTLPLLWYLLALARRSLLFRCSFGLCLGAGSISAPALACRSLGLEWDDVASAK
ncbi:uncharacterized protein J3R85_000616 [Psidium guajava]|nr:uncharacterized protein J3R85_000616 [Psidium guajava]